MLPDGRRTRTTARTATASVARVKWAQSCVSDREWEQYIMPRLCEEAAGRGHLEELKWLRAEGCPWDARACGFAARGGHLDVLKWLRAEGCPWDKWACELAAKGGHLGCVPRTPRRRHGRGCGAGRGGAVGGRRTHFYD